MAKNKLAQQEKVEEHFDFDFDEMLTPYEENSMGDLVNALITASNHQLSTAMDLTKLIVAQQSSQSMTENQIIELFQKVTEVVVAGYPFKKMVSEIQ